jgi:hypothetical protein
MSGAVACRLGVPTTRNDVIRSGPANPLGTGPLASSINRTPPPTSINRTLTPEGIATA